MFASLRVRNYRLFATGQVVSLIGTWGQRVAQDWLVLELSHGSPVALGVAVALQFTPTLLLSLWAGVLADRYDKRRLLIALQIAMGFCALLLGLLDVGGIVQLWQVYVLCVLLGCFSAVDVPIRQAFAVEMVGRAQVTNAVALNSMTFNMARIVGPAIAGFAIVAIGTGWVFLVNAASFAAVVVGLLLMNPDRLHRVAPLPREAGQLRDGLRYVRARPDLIVLLTLVFFVATFGLNFHTMLPVVARNVFGRGADAYGLLSTFLAVGTLAGATLAARRSGRGRPRLRLVFGAALAFGLSEVLVGLMPTYASFGLLLVPCGAAVLTFTTAANSTVQLSVDPSMRGRVMGLYMLLFLGGNPLGGPLMGWIAEAVGGRAPIVVGGVVTILASLACGAVLVRRSRSRPAAEQHGCDDQQGPDGIRQAESLAEHQSAQGGRGERFEQRDQRRGPGPHGAKPGEVEQVGQGGGDQAQIPHQYQPDRGDGEPSPAGTATVTGQASISPPRVNPQAVVADAVRPVSGLRPSRVTAAKPAAEREQRTGYRRLARPR